MGIRTDAMPSRSVPGDDNAICSAAPHDHVMRDSLEEDSLEDDTYLSNDILRELEKFGMEGLG